MGLMVIHINKPILRPSSQLRPSLDTFTHEKILVSHLLIPCMCSIFAHFDLEYSGKSPTKFQTITCCTTFSINFVRQPFHSKVIPDCLQLFQLSGHGTFVHEAQ